MIVTLADTNRKAAHGTRHVCGFCRQRIAVGETYNDQRCADNGTVWTWRAHLRCIAFAAKVVDPWDWASDGLDHVSFADYVAENRDLAVEMGVITEVTP